MEKRTAHKQSSKHTIKHEWCLQQPTTWEHNFFFLFLSCKWDSFSSIAAILSVFRWAICYISLLLFAEIGCPQRNGKKKCENKSFAVTKTRVAVQSEWNGRKRQRRRCASHERTKSKRKCVYTMIYSFYTRLALKSSRSTNSRTIAVWHGHLSAMKLNVAVCRVVLVWVVVLWQWCVLCAYSEQFETWLARTLARVSKRIAIKTKTVLSRTPIACFSCAIHKTWTE